MEAIQVFDFVEIIHIKLTDEGSVVFGFEIFGENFDELFGIGNQKRVSLGSPFNNAIVFFIFNHLVSGQKKIRFRVFFFFLADFLVSIG